MRRYAQMPPSKEPSTCLSAESAARAEQNVSACLGLAVPSPQDPSGYFESSSRAGEAKAPTASTSGRTAAGHSHGRSIAEEAARVTVGGGNQRPGATFELRIDGSTAVQARESGFGPPIGLGVLGMSCAEQTILTEREPEVF